METASFNNGTEGFNSTDNLNVLTVQLELRKIELEHAKIELARETLKAQSPQAQYPPSPPSTPQRRLTQLRPLPTPDHEVTFQPKITLTTPSQTPSVPPALSISKPSQDAFRIMTDLAKQLPNIDDDLLKDQTKFKATLMTITTKEQQLFCAIPPHLFASAVLTKCTGKASLLLSKFSGQDPSLSWNKIKATLTAEFSTELVHLDPFQKFATLSSSRLSADQLYAHSDSLAFHEAVCGTVDWKFYQTLTLCQLTNPALYRFVISPTPPLSFHDLQQRIRRFTAQGQSQPPAGPRFARNPPATTPPSMSQPRGRLTAEMRKHRSDNKLCMYCGEHSDATSCPKKRTVAPPRIMSVELHAESDIPSNV